MKRTIRKKILFSISVFVFFSSMASFAEQDSIEDLRSKAMDHYGKGQFEEAIEVSKQAVAITDKDFGKDSLESAEFLGNIGALYQLVGQETQGAEYLKKAREIRNRHGMTGVPVGIQTEDFFDSVGENKKREAARLPQDFFGSELAEAVPAVFTNGTQLDGPGNGALELVVKTDRERYSEGDCVNMVYEITNTGSAEIGFYLKFPSGFKLLVSDANKNTFRYYYNQMAQRGMPSIFPDEYVRLQPNEKWQKSESHCVRRRKIGWRERLYLDAEYAHEEYDEIVFPKAVTNPVSMTAAFTAADPNPRHYTQEDCMRSGFSVNRSETEFISGRIPHSFSNTDGVQLYGMHPTLLDLVLYCQHKHVFEKEAWSGTIISAPLKINIE